MVNGVGDKAQGCDKAQDGGRVCLMSLLMTWTRELNVPSVTSQETLVWGSVDLLEVGRVCRGQAGSVAETH